MWAAFRALSLSSKLLFLGVFVALLCAIFSIGYIKGTAKGNEKILELQRDAQKVSADYEKKLSEKKVEIVTKYVDKVVTVKQKEKEYIRIANTVVPNDKLVIPSGWIKVLDASATNSNVSENEASNPAPFEPKETVLPVITSNYSMYHQCQARLSSLQELIKEHNKTIDELNKKAKK